MGMKMSSPLSSPRFLKLDGLMETTISDTSLLQWFLISVHPQWLVLARPLHSDHEDGPGPPNSTNAEARTMLYGTRQTLSTFNSNRME